eukprot:scaffold127422_cov54-Phaeocystis_antarctica.AAC.1
MISPSSPHHFPIISPSSPHHLPIISPRPGAYLPAPFFGPLLALEPSQRLRMLSLHYLCAREDDIWYPTILQPGSATQPVLQPGSAT